MCIIIDTNTLAPVFNRDCSVHREFKPVFDWIFWGQGRVVYGGTKYKDELRKAPRYFGIFLELRKKRKAIEVDDCKVDRRQAELEAAVKHRDFDDAHIIAIVIVAIAAMVVAFKRTNKNHR